MYYRFILKKDGKISGLFHPLDEQQVPKENGLYDIVLKYFSTLPHKKNFKKISESWFKEKGVRDYIDGINELRYFYASYDISIIELERDNLEYIVEEDEYQVWCLARQVNRNIIQSYIKNKFIQEALCKR